LIEKVNLNLLDYVGYAQVLPPLNEAMNDYANGTMTLQQLKAALQSAYQAQAAAQQGN